MAYSIAPLLLALLVLLALYHDAQCKNSAVPMQKFAISLDKPPEERWLNLLSHFNSSVPAIVKYFDKMVPSKLARELLEKIGADLDGLLGDLGKEMKSVAEYWKIDLGIVVSLNFAYELRRMGGGHPNTTGNVTTSGQPTSFGMACTSIVAQNETGRIFHGRNLDWDLPDDIRNITVQVDFVKGGKVIFTGITVAGYVGILTGMSRAGFSLSINERNLGGSIVEDALEAVLLHSWCPTHLARQVLANSLSYVEALETVEKERLTAPAYFIAAGSQPGEGSVITRDRNSLTDLWVLDVSASVPNSWYLLETNYDHWKTPQPDDDRRFYGNLYMQSMGQAVAASVTGLYSVLRTWPVCNPYTTYTCIMTPQTGDMESYNIFT